MAGAGFQWAACTTAFVLVDVGVVVVRQNDQLVVLLIAVDALILPINLVVFDIEFFRTNMMV